MRDYRQLDAWKACHELVLALYAATERLDDRDSLIARTRRAALLAPAKLANGAARPDGNAFPAFVGRVLGYLSELGYYLRMACIRGLIAPDVAERLLGLRGRAVFYTWRLFERLTSDA